RVYSASNHKLLGLVPGSLDSWIGRSDVEDSPVTTVAWKGDLSTLDKTQRTVDLPDGRYYLDVMALRPFGRENVDRDYDIWRSPTITFKRAPNARSVLALS
ncbi:hypothetical protein THASP1DRAFT_26791, partial [Thamnocephalis sphaerospora]